MRSVSSTEIYGLAERLAARTEPRKTNGKVSAFFRKLLTTVPARGMTSSINTHFESSEFFVNLRPHGKKRYVPDVGSLKLEIRVSGNHVEHGINKDMHVAIEVSKCQFTVNYEFAKKTKKRNIRISSKEPDVTAYAICNVLSEVVGRIAENLSIQTDWDPKKYKW